MQVLVDGRSVYLPPYSKVSWEDIPLLMDDIERIEVIRGPSAASHGANSTQGVINIITRDASANEGIRATITQGEGGINDISANFGRSGELLDYRLSVGRRSDNGFGNSLLNDNNVTRIFNWRSNYHPNGDDSIDIQFGHSDGIRGEGVLGRSTDPFRDVTSSNDFQQASWSRMTASSDEIKVQYSHTRSTHIDNKLSNFPLLEIVTQRHDVEFQHNMDLGSSNRFVWGTGLRDDSLEAAYWFTNKPPTLKQSRIFAHDEWRVTPATVMNMGAMWEDDGMGNRKASPRLSVNYHLTPKQTFRISSSIAYRSPAMLEEYANTQTFALRQAHAKGGLSPEKMFSKEMGYVGEFSSLGLTVDTRIYSDQLTGLIWIDPIVNTTNMTIYSSAKNMYSVSFTGWESSLHYRWDEMSDVIFNFARQITSCSAYALPTEINSIIPTVAPAVSADYYGNLSRCPKMTPFDSASLLLKHPLGDGVSFSTGYYYQGEMRVLDAGAVQTPMRRVDIKITKSFGNLAKSGGGEVALVMQNVFQDRYSEYINVMQLTELLFDRRAYLTTTLHF
jgi:iron complex outermembrane receptor protein